MTDIARLGYAVDTTQVEAGARALGSLEGAAERAERAAVSLGKNLGSGLRGASSAVDALIRRLEKLDTLLARMDRGVSTGSGLAGAANQAARVSEQATTRLRQEKKAVEELALARARAAQFGRDYNTRIGIGSRPASSQGATTAALTERMKQELRAEQAAQRQLVAQRAATAQAAYNQQLGIPARGTPTNSARASASALREQLREREKRDKMMQEQLAATLASGSYEGAQGRIDRVTGVSGRSGGLTQADLEANAGAMRALRAQMDPLYASYRRYRDEVERVAVAERMGALTANQAAQARNRARGTFRGEAAQARNTGGQGLRRDQALNYGYQFGDIVASQASGAPWELIALQQGPQIAQIWATTGLSVSKTFSEIGKGISSMFTTTRVLTGGIIGIGVALAVMYAAWRSEHAALRASLRGTGRGAGTDVDTLAAMASRSADSSGIARGDAKTVAADLARSGRIQGAMIGRVTGLARDYAYTTGQDVDAVGKELADMFADPAKGAEELQQKLGTVTAAQRALVESFVRAGDARGAQQALYDVIRAGSQSATENLTGLGRAWAAVVKGFRDLPSMLFDKGSLADQITELKAERARLVEQQGSVYFRASGQDNSSDIGDVDRRIREKENRVRQIEQDQKKQEVARLSNEADALGKQYAPTLGTFQQLQTEYNKLVKQIETGSGANTEQAERYRLALERIADAMRSLQTESGKVKTDLERAMDTQAIAMAEITARTPQQRADLARRRVLDAAVGTPTPELQYKANAARDLSLGQDLENEIRYRERLNESRRQGLQGMQAEIAGVGQATGANERLQKALELTNAAREHAYQLYGNSQLGNDEIDRIRRETEEWGRLNDQLRQTRLTYDLMFEQQQATRKPGDREVYSRLNQAGLLTNGQIESREAKQAEGAIRYNVALEKQTEMTRDLQFERDQLFRSDVEGQIASRLRSMGIEAESAYGKYAAGVMRTNEMLRETKETLREPFTSFFEKIAEGTSVKKAAAGSIKSLGSRMAQQGSQALYDGLWKAAGSIPGLSELGLGPKMDGSSASSALWVRMAPGVGGFESLLKLANPATASANMLNQQFGGFGKEAAIQRSPLGQLGAPEAANTRVGAAFAALEAAKPFGASGNFGFAGNYRRGVDPRLTQILSEAAERSGVKVEAFSGLRPGDSRFHGKGMATDVRLFDPTTGKAIPNYQNAEGFRAYEKFAQQARAVQMEKYPDLANDFRWGGYFGGNKGKYGAMDTMHFDLGGRSVGMGGGSWANGLTPQQRAMWPGATSQGMGAGAPVTAQFPQVMQQATQQTQAFTQELGTGAQGLGSFGQGLGEFGNILAGAGGQAGGGGGGAMGIFGSILGLVGKFAGAFDEGGSIPRGQWGIAGERGPEAVMGPAAVIGRQKFASLRREAATAPAPAASSRSFSYGDTQIIIQGNADEKVVSEFKRELDRRDKAREKREASRWRDTQQP